MKTILNNDILKEMPNQQALGSFNDAVSKEVATNRGFNNKQGIIDQIKRLKENRSSASPKGQKNIDKMVSIGNAVVKRLKR